MRRARIALTLVGLSLVFCAPGSLRAASGGSAVRGIAVLDYTRKPTFKVGDYVRYLVTAVDQDGNPQARYFMTVMIAGQEVWWGERCFYLETIEEKDRSAPTSGATLMSYSIFDDSLPEENVTTYARKLVDGYDPETGELSETLTAVSTPSLSSRPAPARSHTVRRDTLGADTVQAPPGTLQGLKILMHQAWSRTGGHGDSTTYEEINEDRIQTTSDLIPLTGFALEVTKTLSTRRSWLIGRSKDAAPARTVSASTVTARIVGYGHGLKSTVLPADRVHSFDDPPAGTKPAPAARPRTTSGVARRR